MSERKAISKFSFVQKDIKQYAKKKKKRQDTQKNEGTSPGIVRISLLNSKLFFLNFSLSGKTKQTCFYLNCRRVRSLPTHSKMPSLPLSPSQSKMFLYFVPFLFFLFSREVY